MGLGAVLAAPDGSRYMLSQAAPGKGCNNEAELRALMAALSALQLHGALSLLVYSDSSVLVDQLVAGTKACRPIARLALLFDQARAMLGSFDDVSLRWIPRHRNGEADALARAGLGLPA